MELIMEQIGLVNLAFLGVFIILLMVGIFHIYSGSKAKYFRLKRRSVETGWKWLLAAFGIGVLFLGYQWFGPFNPFEAGISQLNSISTQTATVTVDVTSLSTLPPTVELSATNPPTAQPEASLTPVPINTQPAGSPSPSVIPTSTARPTLSPTVTQTRIPTLVPSATVTPEATWTQTSFTPTVTNTRAPTATESIP
ncbi:MAG TPA: hypothetical protein VN226_02080 [Anaerolineales bacterium]|nr:hypothetical protein [Anaerolineales bacterium]